jgi:RNA polymerase sigma factor (TIGR02999 family)
LLLAWRGGDERALGQLIPLVHDELRQIARRCMRGEAAEQSLQATALVSEAYVRLVDVRRVNWTNRIHFLAMAARIMRRILVDSARAKHSQKRGGEIRKVSLDEACVAMDEPAQSLLALNDALDRLSAVDERKGQIVELRFFGGLTVEETAAALNVSVDTVMRDWKLAKAWLRRDLASAADVR